MDQSVTCTGCGASTPLPSDLRVPTFACSFCKRELATGSFAGKEAVSVDALVAHVRAQVEAPGSVQGPAPRFDGQSKETRASACLRCKALVGVPLDLTVHTLRCAGCGYEQPVAAHISDKERFEMDMQRQLAGNAALKALRAEGVACAKCGGKNDVPDDGSVQVPCRFCGAVILLAGHVDETAVARARLKQGVYGMRDELMRKHEAQQRRERIVTAVGLALVFGIVGVAMLVSFLSR